MAEEMEKKEQGEQQIQEPGTTLTPPVDIISRENETLVLVDLAGTTREEVEIKIEKGLISVTAKTKAPDTENLPLLYQEYQEGDYEVWLRLSERIKKEEISADFKDGLLTLTLPISEEQKPRQISIKAA